MPAGLSSPGRDFTRRFIGSAVLIGTSILVLVPAARAQTSAGNAQIQMGGALTDYLDLEAQYGAAYDPASALYLEFVDPVAGDSSFVVYSSGPVTAGEYRLENCNDAGCPFTLTIMPPPFGSNSFSTVGSSASGQGVCNLLFEVHSDGDVSGLFDCAWDAVGVTAEGYFETTLFEEDTGGGIPDPPPPQLPPPETEDFNWPLWAGVAGAVTVGGLIASRLIFRRKPDAKDTDVCQELVAQYERLYAKWDEQYRRAEQGLSRLEAAQQRLKAIELDRMELMRQQQEVASIAITTGVFAGVLAAILAAKFCLLVMKKLTAAFYATVAEKGLTMSALASPAVQAAYQQLSQQTSQRAVWWRGA